MTRKLLTEELPGTGGIFKAAAEDFQVEEIPCYLPSGVGEHLFIEVEKRNLTTLDLVRQLARQCGVRERDIGYAGLKDARGVTRQWLSLPASEAGGKIAAENGRFRILTIRRHRNKLRLGHLRGNRFRIRIRNTKTGALELATAILRELEQKGVPNTFGPQRYGALGNSSEIGGALLREDFEGAVRELLGPPERIRDPRWRQGAQRFAEGDLEGALGVLPQACHHERRIVQALLAGRSHRQALLALPQRLLRLYLAAYQSELFDRIVALRLPELGTLWPGDLAMKHSNGACFSVPDPEREQARADVFEISPSGPLFGCKVLLATDQAGELEQRLLAERGLRLEAFSLPGGLRLEGCRRPLRVPVAEPEVREEGEDLLLSFILPAGSYASSVMSEIMKNGGEDPGRELVPETDANPLENGVDSDFCLC
ncbi:MAG: tRNA pseudouridine(13) synthase TruD [Deltaproteobacteria bacterium]|nr:tRNA pseudouridine(13) synthase TruD [Deltaproteobacteria bacterium]